MRQLTLWLALALAAPLAARLAAGDCIPVEGEQIRGADLRRAHPAFAAVDPETVVAPAPLPGSRRAVGTAELSRMARRLLGPGQGPQHWDAPVCFEYAASALTVPRLSAALERLFPPPFRVEITSFTQFPVPGGEIEFPDYSRRSLRPDRADGTSLLRGWVRYQQRRRHPFWVRIRVSSPKMKPVAAEALSPGQAVEASQIRMVPVDGWLAGEPASAADIVGLEPRRQIAAGTPLTGAMFLPPREVRKGDVVRVTSEVGLARVELETRAETQARLGDRIVLKNLQTGQRFVARVDGHGRASVGTAMPRTAPPPATPRSNP